VCGCRARELHRRPTAETALCDESATNATALAGINLANTGAKAAPAAIRTEPRVCGQDVVGQGVAAFCAQDAIPAHGRASDSYAIPCTETSQNDYADVTIEGAHDNPVTSVVILCSRAETGHDEGACVKDHAPAAYSQDIADGAA
jgi:hypothetical protein